MLRSHSKAIACVAMTFVVGTSVTFAGEITGTGVSLKPLHGRSDCAYSGLQDDLAADEGFFRNPRVQNWGQSTDLFKNILIGIGINPHPGVACNPIKPHEGEP